VRWIASGTTVLADPEARRPGRGAYTCRTRDCFERAARGGGFNRAFRRAVTAPLGGENVHWDER
jgi:predicted RNA-binding protein YlxR (DUF448 family)